MSTYQMNPIADFRNEGWTLTGGATLNQVWASGSDADYTSNPASKGRGAVTFEQDISSNSIADGSNIESVTVYLRAEATDAVTRSVTVNVLSQDDTSYFTSRRIILSTTPTTVEVATYTADPLNRSWNKDLLNQLILQVFTYDSTGATDKVRVYELYAVVNFRTMPVVSITDPSGTVDATAPEVDFTYTQIDGDIQASAEYKIFLASDAQAVTFDPDNTPALYPDSTQYTVKPGDTLFSIAFQKLGSGSLWPSIFAGSTLLSGDPNVVTPGEVLNIPGIASISGDTTSFTLPFALAPGSYYLYLRATSTRGATGAWDSQAFTVSSASGSPGVPGGSVGSVGIGGGGGFESVIADPETSNVYLAVRDGSNLLSVQQADFETTTDSLGWTGANCTVTQDFTTAFGTGLASLQLKASSAANMSAVSDWVEVPEDTPLTVVFQAIAIATGRTIDISVAFADDEYDTIGSAATASGTDATGTYSSLELTGFSVPLGASQMQITITVVSPANAEVHNFDQIGVMYGTGSVWSNGGLASRNLLTSNQCNADNPLVGDAAWTAINGTTYSRVTTSGTGSDGTEAFKMLYAGISGTSSYVATGTVFTDTTTSPAFFLNKPAGVADGDVLVAYVSVISSASTGYVTQSLAPAGWTVVDTSVNGQVSLSVLMRDGLAADPSSWTGSVTEGPFQVCKQTIVVAYRGAAPTAYQFQNEGMSSSISGGDLLATPSVYNSDPNAWRLSAFAIADNAASGSMTANITSSYIPPIQYVGKGTPTSGRDNHNTTWSVDRPANLVAGDLMVAGVQSAFAVTFNAPTGWTKVYNSASIQSSMAVFVRTATGSEPPNWTGTVTSGGSSSAAPWVAECSAYRNCDVAANQFLVSAGSSGSSASYTSPTIVNTNANAWRIFFFGADTDGGSGLDTNEIANRGNDSNGPFNPSSSITLADSNGPVATGNQSRVAYAQNTANVNGVQGWIGMLMPAVSGATPGANETERHDSDTGTATPYLTMEVNDSNGVAATGNTTVYGTFTPGSGSGTLGMVGFEGFLIPAASAIAPTNPGEVGATLTDYVDIRNVSPDVFARCGSQVTVQAAFLGSSVGTPHLKLYSYSGNELISTQVAEGQSFSTSVWSKSIAKFVLLPNATRFKLGVSAVNRNVSDYVLYDKVSVALGSETVYRPGTGRLSHPIFNTPLIEFAEDLGQGYGDWSPLLGSGGTPFSYDADTGLCSVVDQTMTPLSHRKYRARTLSYGLLGDSFISDYGPESPEVTLTGDNWWLKDMTVPELTMKLQALGTTDTDVVISTSDTSTLFQPVGPDKPMIVSQGYKGDIVTLQLVLRSADYMQLMQVFALRHTMLLQSALDKSWWVRPYGDLDVSLQMTYDQSSNPLRFVTVAFAEVDPDQ